MSRPEARVENRLRDGVKARGGIAVKLSAPGYRSWPDRIVLMPGGHAYFVELKAPGKKPTAQQTLRHRQIEALGFFVTVLDSVEDVDRFLQTKLDKQVKHDKLLHQGSGLRADHEPSTNQLD